MSLIVKFDTLRSLAFGSISGTYAAVGSSFQNPVRLICITNNTDGDMLFSFDGVNNHVFVPSHSFKLFDLTTNRQQNENSFEIIAGTQVYVKQSTAASSGSVYVETIYAL